MAPEMVRLRKVIRESADTFTWELEPPPAFSFAPGQFDMLYLFGKGEVPVSISGDPGDPDRIGHTIRAVGAVTKAMLAERPGARVGLRGPYGKPWPLDRAQGKDVVLVAGGLGLAPLRPVVYHVLRHRDDYDRFLLLYGARTPEDLLFRREIERWRGRLDIRVRATVDRAGPGWRGNVGVVTRLLEGVSLCPEDTVAMICGPEVMMRFVARELERRGLDGSDIHVSLERNMKCGVGLCGHCQMGPSLVCRDGPVYRYDAVERAFAIREL